MFVMIEAQRYDVKKKKDYFRPVLKTECKKSTNECDVFFNRVISDSTVLCNENYF